MAEHEQAARPVKRRANPLMILIVVALAALVGLEVLHLRGEIAQAQSDRETLQTQLDAKRQENDALSSALEKADDPAFLQELARDQLGYVKPGEKSFYDVSN